MKKHKSLFYTLSITFLLLLSYTLSFSAVDNPVFTAKDLLNTQTCDKVSISPNGKWIAYTVKITRSPKEKPGSAFQELYLISTEDKKVKPVFTGKVIVKALEWKSDSSRLGFIVKGGEDPNAQIWTFAVDGGMPQKVTFSISDVEYFQWHPLRNKIAYIAQTPPTDKEELLKKKGYGFIFYEENLKHKNLYLLDLDTSSTRPITRDITVWDFVFGPNGKKIAMAASPKNLIDHKYMFRKIYLLDLPSEKMEKLTTETKKLGKYRFSPDGKRIVYTAALERKDHAVSQVYVLDIKTGEEKNLTEPDFQGHVSWAVWRDSKTILYFAGEGVWPTLSLKPVNKGKREVILNSEEIGITFKDVSFSKDFKYAAFVGSSPRIPGELFFWQTGQKKVRQLTQLNPWLSQRKLGKQEIINYKSRDGWDIEGLLIYPANYEEGRKYPLIVTVHGGPESHYSNKWVTRYSAPGQVLAGKGYLVFYPNYRSSTGYGLKFALVGYKDPAGKEFDDIADGIDYLIEKGLADPERVGIGGGSYGGYASAWFASYYTKYVRAACMFVGITDLLSKRGCGDIPYEELYVHAGDMLEKNWEFSLKRSPVYWAHQSKTAVLILGGKDDTRIHPGQSLEFYRRLKMNNHPAVRLVQYPGEKHGNKKQVSQIDFLHRVLQWFDWYVRDKKPLDGPMPPLDISDSYGIFNS